MSNSSLAATFTHSLVLIVIAPAIIEAIMNHPQPSLPLYANQQAPRAKIIASVSRSIINIIEGRLLIIRIPLSSMLLEVPL